MGMGQATDSSRIWPYNVEGGERCSQGWSDYQEQVRLDRKLDPDSRTMWPGSLEESPTWLRLGPLFLIFLARAWNRSIFPGLYYLKGKWKNTHLRDNTLLGIFLVVYFSISGLFWMILCSSLPEFLMALQYLTV